MQAFENTTVRRKTEFQIPEESFESQVKKKKLAF